MQYAQTQQQFDRKMLKPKSSNQRNSYLVSNSRLNGLDQQLPGRSSFTFIESNQEDFIQLQAHDTGNNSSKKLNHAATLNYDSIGGDLNSQQMLLGSKKNISKPSIKKKGLQQQQQLQQQLPKQQGVNLVNLNLNFNSVPQSQLPPTYPLMKNQENIQNSIIDNTNNTKKKKLLQQQYEPIYKVPQQNNYPNRLQKIQTLPPKLTPQIQQNFDVPQIKGYLQEQQNQGGYLVDLNQSSSVLTNSTNLTNKNTLQNSYRPSLYQVSEAMQAREENCNEDLSESPRINYQQANNEIMPKIICNHKQKMIKEYSNPLNQRAYGSQQQDLRNNRVDENVLDPTITPQERMDRMMRSLDTSASKVLQLKHKSKGTLDNNRTISDQNEVLKQRQVSQEQYDDSSLYNNQLNMAPITQKGKQFYQQNQKMGLVVNINSNSQKNNLYNGIRNEPSSHQFIALKLEMDERMKQSFNNQLQPINQITEVDFEQSQEGNIESIVQSKNLLVSKNRRQASNSVSREFDFINTDQSDNLKTFGVSLQQLQLQKKDLQNYKNYKTLQNQLQSEQNQTLQTFDPSLQYIENIQSQLPLQENKKTNRKIINANPSSKQETNKRYSGVVVTVTNTVKQKPSSNSSNTIMTQQQKDRLSKNDKDQQISLKIKIFLDFQRIINFSNNMTMQPVPPNGVKQYKAYITKGNNGVLIRACLKNRWWWSLSEQSEDYENINFLWTQWRKPLFYKIIKDRAELSVTPVKDEENDNNQVQTKQQGKQNGVSNQNIEQIPQSTDIQNESTESANQLVKQQNDGNKKENNEGEEQGSDEIEFEKQEIASPTQNERQGYNDLSNNLQDLQKSASKKQNQGSISPIGRKASQQLSLQDPFCKIGALVNEKDLQLIKNYAKQSKKKKQSSTNSVPPVFNKEEYDQGIEKEYEKMRQEGGNQVNVFKNPLKQKMHNHMEYNFHLANKKALYYNMKQYYTLMNQNVFDYLPTTFHIQHGLNDPEFTNFVNYYNKFEIENPKRKNVWIIKPGESSNRGNGIQVAGDVNSVRDIIRVRESHQNGFKKTYIIQKYLDRPFLYNKRKFDIRCFMLMTNYNNTMKAYWYIDGYIRTSTKEFTLKNLENRMIHLTNEAVQKRGDDFGKFENGNKLSYAELQKYIDTTYPKENFNFMQQVYPQMKKLAYDSVCSVYTKIDKKKRNFSFELFGLDFMVDDAFNTWLIEINTNPSLTIAAPLMSRLLPALIDNVLKIAIDPIFPPPNFPKSKKHLIPEQIYENNKFELLFDSDVDGKRIEKLYQNISNKIDEQIEEDCRNEEVYDDDDAEVDEEDEEEEGC